MSKQVIIAYNAVNAKVVKGDREAMLAVSEAVSYTVEGFEHMEAHRTAGWDGRSTMFDWVKQVFPRGLVAHVEKELRGKGYKVQLVNRPVPEPLGDPFPKVDDNGYTARYDYQPQTVQELIKRGQMIARVATGGGKSRIAKIAYGWIKRPTLFLTTRKALMYQMKDAFEDAGWNVGVMGDSVWTPDSNLNVAMVQTLAARLKQPDADDTSAEAIRQRRIRQNTIKLLGQVEFLIGEEAHESSGDSYFEVLKYCRKAEFRLALTATPFMKADGEANMRLMAAFGEIGIEVSEKMLIDRGILAKPIFQYVDCEQPRKLKRTTPWQRAMELGITSNEARNNDIIARVKKGRQYGLSSMILVTRRAHGTALSRQMREQGMKVVFLFGATSTAKRKQALDALKRGLLDAVIGSTILDVGVDVPAIGQIILAGGGKDETTLRQRIGRGLREKKKGPNVCPIFDYRDRGNKHLQEHSLIRQHIVKSTPGFGENVLPNGVDMDYEKLGFTKIAA